MRTLIYVPIVRTQADVTTFAEVLRRRAVEKPSPQEREQSIQTIDQVWAVLREEIAKLNLPHSGLRVYQDGLPYNEREVQMVIDLARTGSPNHQFLLSLIEAGATLVGTESPELLLEDCQLVQQTLDAQNRGESEEVRARQQFWRYALLERRDRYIGQRINDTLLPDETGILFLDMFHSIGKHLQRDIRVLYQILQPAGEN